MRAALLLITLFMAPFRAEAQLAPPTPPPAMDPPLYSTVWAVTPNGTQFQALILVGNEWNTDWMSYIVQKNRFQHPNAIVIGIPARAYNCFSYALMVPGMWVNPDKFSYFLVDNSLSTTATVRDFVQRLEDKSLRLTALSSLWSGDGRC